MAELGNPIRIRNLEIRNRFVMAPMVMHLATEDGRITEELIKHYSARSRGGIGLIVVEASAIDWENRISKKNVGIYKDSLVPGLAKLVDSIHAYGAKAFIQLCHAGPNSSVASRPVGPSRVGTGGREPVELGIDQIKDVEDEFCEAARRAKKAGFDGVEIHGAHFLLLSSFLSSHTNLRTDAYGGTTRKKTKFVVDIVKSLRKKLGHYPIQCRMNGIENAVRGIDIEEAAKIARILQNAGVDSLSISGSLLPDSVPSHLRSFSSESVPDFLREYPYGCYIPCAALIKKAVTVPVIGVGMVRTAEFAREVMDRESCDMLALGRALLADPEFATKTLSGRDNEIVPWKH